MIAFTDTLVKIPQNVYINGVSYSIKSNTTFKIEILKNMIEFIIRNLNISIYNKKRQDYREYDIKNGDVTMVNCNCKLVHLKFIKMIQNKLDIWKDDIFKIYLEVLNRRLTEYKYDFDMDWI